MKLVAGSYERFVWAWDADLSSGELRQSFCRPAHLGPVKCAAGWGGDLVTGGSDDVIHIFDIRSGKDVGLAEFHKGSVTALELFGPSRYKTTHLFSASEDGTVCVWDADSWVHLKTMKGKAPISDFTVHGSGRLGLSVEKGGGFRMWNLIKGRCSFAKKMPFEASLVKFLPHAEGSYAVVCDTAVEIHNAEDGKTLQRLCHEKQVLCMAAGIQEKLLFTGAENGSLCAWDFRSGKAAHVIFAAGPQSRRIKGVDVLNDSHFLASASSDGLVKVWDTRFAAKASGEPLLQAETKARLTCIVGFSAPFAKVSNDAEKDHEEKNLKVSAQKKKRPATRSDSEENDESEEEEPSDSEDESASEQSGAEADDSEEERVVEKVVPAKSKRMNNLNGSLKRKLLKRSPGKTKIIDARRGPKKQTQLKRLKK